MDVSSESRSLAAAASVQEDIANKLCRAIDDKRNLAGQSTLDMYVQ